MDLREQVGYVHQHLTNAYVTLADPATRAKALLDGGRMQPPTTDELHARALAALRNEHVAPALSMAEAAVARMPDNVDYQAAAIWVRSHQPRAELRVHMADLDDLLLQNPKHTEARYYRAVLRHRAGFSSAAKQDLEYVLQCEPQHSDARSELRRVVQAANKDAEGKRS